MSLRHAASDTVRPALLMWGRVGSAVDTAVVALGTSSFVGRVFGNCDVGGAVFLSFKNKPTLIELRTLRTAVYVDVRSGFSRLSLILLLL